MTSLRLFRIALSQSLAHHPSSLAPSASSAMISPCGTAAMRHLSSNSGNFGRGGQDGSNRRNDGSFFSRGSERGRANGGVGGGGGGVRLRRPAYMTKTRDQDLRAIAANRGTRPQTITLFPGDFTDDPATTSMWDDDEEFDDDGEGDLYGGISEEEQQERERIRGEILRAREKDKAQRDKWIANSQPPVRVPQIDERGRSYGRGGRKTARARVWIQPGFGEVVVNRKNFLDYFQRMSDRELILEPFIATRTCGAFDMQVQVNGGGLRGQAGAIRHGLANALNAFNPDKYRPSLKKLGMLTRDARKVERKKVGLKKARKAPQWVRR